MNKQVILLLTSEYLNPSKEEIDQLQDVYPEVEIIIRENSKYSIEDIKKAEIIVGRPKIEDLKHAKNLKWLQTPSAGCLPYTYPEIYANEEVLLSNASGTYGKQISDHVLGLIISFNHNFPLYNKQKQEHLWKGIFPEKDIFESTILIVGFGDIGRHVALKTKALGMKTIVIKRTPIEKPIYVDKIGITKDLKNFIPEADYICLTLPLTPETVNLFDEKCISLMKKDSYFINIARGDLVDEKALIKALKNKQIAGAGLDVTMKEPLEKESPLWDLENVILTPHVSGCSFNDPKVIFNIFKANLQNYRTGQKLRNQVDFEIKY
ncbi:MAG: D-2-hydroxyacid dehydrogenase [Sphaerochaetaceae bacterium]